MTVNNTTLTEPPSGYSPNLSDCFEFLRREVRATYHNCAMHQTPHGPKYLRIRTRQYNVSSYTTFLTISLAIRRQLYRL